MMAGRASLCLVPCHANGSDGRDICLPLKAACALSCLALEHNQTCVEAASKDYVAALTGTNQKQSGHCLCSLQYRQGNNQPSCVRLLVQRSCLLQSDGIKFR